MEATQPNTPAGILPGVQANPMGHPIQMEGAGEMKNRLLELAQKDLAMARDNLYRARSAAKHRDPTLQWGQSGQTLNEIIADYEKWEQEALATVEEAKAK